VSDYLESDGVSRQVDVRSGHDRSKKAEAEEDMEGYSSSTELLRRCFALLCGCAGLEEKAEYVISVVRSVRLVRICGPYS
jgi:hypothetical protein